MKRRVVRRETDTAKSARPDGPGYKDQIKLRKHLVLLSDLAGRYGIVIIIVRHFNKDSDSKEAIYRGSGHIDISGAARSVLQVWDLPGSDDGARAIASVKANLAERPATLVYRVEAVPAVDHDGNLLMNRRGQPTTVGRIKWVSKSKLTATQLMRSQRESQKAEAEAWLEKLLSEHGGSMLKQEIEALAKAEGFSESPLREGSYNIEDLCKKRTPTSPSKGVWWLDRHGSPTREQLKALVGDDD